MGNVLDKTKQEQVIALGRLGWSLRRIEQATGVRRETAGGYLRSAGVALRAPGGWGRKPPKPANEVTTGSDVPNPDDNSKPANEVTTGFSPPAPPPEMDCKRTASASEVYRETILLELSRRGLILSRRGKFGGYVLAKPPAAISFAEVIRVIDGPLALAPWFSMMEQRLNIIDWPLAPNQNNDLLRLGAGRLGIAVAAIRRNSSRSVDSRK